MSIMAENTPKKAAGSTDGVAPTKYVTETRPKLPDANVTVTRDEPVIDTRLVELRNDEAKRNADRVQ